MTHCEARATCQTKRVERIFWLHWSYHIHVLEMESLQVDVVYQEYIAEREAMHFLKKHKSRGKMITPAIFNCYE